MRVAGDCLEIGPILESGPPFLEATSHLLY
jgi:hypothetical protein